MALGMFKRIANAWWGWKNRCKPARVSSAFFFSAAGAQGYLHDLYLWYVPCKVCGERTCRWAVKRDKPINPPKQYWDNYNRMMKILTRRKR